MLVVGYLFLVNDNYEILVIMCVVRLDVSM